MFYSSLYNPVYWNLLVSQLTVLFAMYLVISSFDISNNKGYLHMRIVTTYKILYFLLMIFFKEFQMNNISIKCYRIYGNNILIEV